MTKKYLLGSIILILATASLVIFQDHFSLHAKQTDTPLPQKLIPSDPIVDRIHTPFFGDLDQMQNGRMLRVLVNYSRTRFFFVKGAPRGFEYELMHEYEKSLNSNLKKGQPKIHLIFVPMPFDKLFDALEQGLGDVAAAGLTVTPARLKKVDFTVPYISDVSEIIVVNSEVTDIHTLDDLCGRKVYMRKGSSYYEHIQKLNQQLHTRGKQPIIAVEAESHLVTEDILELTNAGVYDICVADNYLAKAWTAVMPNIRIRPDIVIHKGSKIAWAVRKNCPLLRKSLNRFIDKNKKGTLLGNILYKRYYQKSKWISNPTDKKARKRLRVFVDVIKRYSRQYDFDWLAIAAQAYQESRFDQKKVSPQGAVGVMQVLPSTARDKWVDIPDINDLDNNIHAGIKYLHFLRERYFNDPAIDAANQVYFAWAAYNAGPAAIMKMREQAKTRGFNPNRWFFNVEVIAAETVGRETVDYVANINKYYVAYKLQMQINDERQKQAEPAKEVL